MLLVVALGGACSSSSDGAKPSTTAPSISTPSTATQATAVPATATPAAATPARAGSALPATRQPGSPAPGVTPVGSPTGAAQLGPIIWATAIDPQTKAPTERVEAFPTTAKTLYATLPIAILEPGTVLTAAWTYNATSLDALTSTVVAQGRYADSWVEFHLVRASDQPWPAGTYAVTVLANGVAVQTAEVKVERGPR